MKKFNAIFLTFVMLTSFTVHAEIPEVSVFINITQVMFDTQPIIETGRTLVPMRAVFEGLGADVYWHDESMTVLIVKNETKIVMKIGEDRFMKYECEDFDEFWHKIVFDLEYEEVMEFDVPPKLINSRTYIPLRAVCEAMGAEVGWDEETRTVQVSASDEFIERVNFDKTFAAGLFGLMNNTN